MTMTKQNQKIKIPNTSGLVTKTNYNTKITELENKIPDINILATKTALTTAENKIPRLVIQLKKQTIILKLLELKIDLIIIIMINTLILQSLINQLVMFLMRDQHRPI